MAATDNAPRIGSIVAAALAVPGVAPMAQTEGSEVGLRYLRYQDSQPGLRRITVDAPAFHANLRLGPEWSVQGNLVADSLSGASPRWHSSISSASVMSDERVAADLKITRHFVRSSVALGASRSEENDYVSNGLNVQASVATDDNNRTWTVGAAVARDRIDATGGGYTGTAIGKRKNTWQLLAGVTQVLNPVDVVQLNLTFSSGRGFFSDPYKAFDNRPDLRDQFALLLRWHHHLVGDGSTLRTSLRGYRDSFGIRATTWTGEWAKPLGERFTVTPSLRYHAQSAAEFYRDPAADPSVLPVPPGFDPTRPPILSYDHRLSAFGALTWGLKLEMAVGEGWTVDTKLEAYEQRGAWRIGGPGSPDLDPFRATIFQIGATRRF